MTTHEEARPRVAVVSFGLSNVDSVMRAIDRVGGAPCLVEDGGEPEVPDLMVLPGVGSFAEAMSRLRMSNLDSYLRTNAVERGVPLLGICLGMQLLATVGFEGERTEGLDLLPGRVIPLKPQAGERSIHVGWNDVVSSEPHFLLEGLSAQSDMYFVHSYHYVPDDSGSVIARTPYGGGFVSLAGASNIFGCQFHPEKSQGAGIRLLSNFVMHAC